MTKVYSFNFIMSTPHAMHINISNCCELGINKIKLKFPFESNHVTGKKENRITESRLPPLKVRVVAGVEYKSIFQSVSLITGLEYRIEQ